MAAARRGLRRCHSMVPRTRRAMIPDPDALVLHELCSMYIGRCGEKIKINSEEILDRRRISPEALQRADCRAGRGEPHPLVRAGMGAKSGETIARQWCPC